MNRMILSFVIGALLLQGVELSTAWSDAHGHHDRLDPRNEPVVSRREAALLEEVGSLVQSDRPTAMDKLVQAIDEESSAAMDFALGVFLTQEGRLAEAESAYVRATDKFAGFRRAWVNLGRVRLLRERPDEAADALREAVGIDGDDPDAWKLLGYAYLLEDRLAASESAYRTALVFAPDDPEIELGLAKVLLNTDRFREALPLIKHQVAETPMYGELWLILVNTHIGLGDESKALVAMETAWRLGVLEHEQLLTLGDLYFNSGLYAKAMERYHDALSGGAVSPDRLLRCAEALFHADRIDDASEFLAKVQERELSDPARAWNLAGRIAEARSETENAKIAYQAALTADPLNAEALMALAMLQQRSGEYELAALNLGRAARLDGYEARALVQLAQMEVELDRFQQAVEHLERAQRSDPDPRVARYLNEVRQIIQMNRHSDLQTH